MEKDKKFIDLVQLSFHLLTKALNELLILNEQKKDPKETELLKLPPFSFYRISLQYMIISEYTKILERDTKDNKRTEKYENRNAASLAKVSRLIYELKGQIFEKEHLENKALLEKIWDSEFYKNLKEDRDQKFLHSDADYKRGTWNSIKTYSEMEIKEAQAVLNDIYEILKRCTGAFNDYQYISPHDNRTQNFIHYHIVNNEFYKKNLMQAVSEGYNINYYRSGDMPRKK